MYTQSIAASQELERARHEGRLQEAAGQIGERLQQTKAWIIASHAQPSISYPVKSVFSDRIDRGIMAQ